MNESQFNVLVDQLFIDLEDALEGAGVDVDCEISGGVMTLTCENNGTKIILSRQPALGELWVAARSGGFHLAHTGAGFFCQVTGEIFPALLDRVLTEQCGEPVSLGLGQG